jgi:FkbM family methyltransferase
MEFNYTKIKIGNWLYRYCFPAYNIIYRRFKEKNDAAEIALLEKVIRPGDTILDIGSNIGFYARILSKLAGDQGRVFCFEPDKRNYARLESNTRKLGNVTLFNAAVSDRPGTLKVYRSKLLNVDHRTYPVSGYDSVEETAAVSIDGLLEQGLISAPKVIKIDIQGYELAALRGMEQTLKSTHPLIIAEFWPHGFIRAGTSAVEFFDYLSNLGYIFSVIGNTVQDLKVLSREEVVENNVRPFEYSFNVLIRKK